MSILAEGRRVVIELRDTKVSGEGGVGIFQLNFQTNCIIRSWEEKVCTINNLSAEVFIRDNNNTDHFVGVARPRKPISFKTSTKREDITYLNLKLNLHPHQVELIEGIRNGSKLSFRLDFYAETHTQSFIEDSFSIHTESGSEERNVQVSQSDWVTCLERMGYGRYFLFEIPLQVANNKKIPENIIQELNSSRKHFLEGNYDVTIGKCRSVLNLLEKLLNDEPLMTKSMNYFIKSRDEREKMSKDERFLFLRKSLLHVTNIAHHPENDVGIISFLRVEAQQVLSITTSLMTYFISYYVRE